MSRRHRRSDLLLDDADRYRFLRLLTKLPESLGIELQALTLRGQPLPRGTEMTIVNYLNPIASFESGRVALPRRLTIFSTAPELDLFTALHCSACRFE